MNTKSLIITVLLGFLAISSHAKGDAIHSAAASGDVPALMKYLKENPKLISARNEPGRTPLCIAAMCGQANAVEFLISEGSDVNDRGFEDMTPLADMAAYGIRDDQRCADTATILLAHGALVDPVDDYHDTPLLHAVESGKSKLARVLLEHGASLAVTFSGVNSRLTPLQYALRESDTDMVAVILPFNPPLEVVDSDGATPLLRAVKNNQVEVARMLLQHGASVNPVTPVTSIPPKFMLQIPGSGRLRAYTTNSSGLPPMGWFFFMQNNIGNTPLHWAVLRRNPDMVALLLKYNPPLDIENDQGATPLNLAEERDLTNIAEMLRQAAPAEAQRADATNPSTIPSAEAMRAVANRIVNGDSAAFGELTIDAANLYKGIDYRRDPWRYRMNAGRMRAAFDVLGEQAGQGNDAAFQALKKSLGREPLKSFAPDALGIAAAAGNGQALDILLDYKQWGIMDSTAGLALRTPAAADIQPAVDFFVAALRDPANAHNGIDSYALPALQSAAAKGNQKAKAALEEHSARSTN